MLERFLFFSFLLFLVIKIKFVFFFSIKYLHENKKLRQNLLNKIISKSSLDNLSLLWQIENYGDHMGPGGFDSQLFLSSFKNWTLQSNLGNSKK